MTKECDKQKLESKIIESIVNEYRSDNENWLKEGILCSAGDLPSGIYFGPDKILFRICLEVRAIRWKTRQLRVKMEQAYAAIPLPSESHDLVKIGDWNKRSSEYFDFADFSESLFESRMSRLAGLKPLTLHGLTAKARLILSECFGATASDETTSEKAVRSIFNDIRDLVGDDQ